MSYYEKLLSCVSYIRSKCDLIPDIAVVLGSGLGDFVKKIDKVCEIPYCDIPEFPISTVQGHAGCFVLGYYNDIPVIVMQGRVHYYEGYDIQDVVLPIRVMKLLGAETLVLTNAAGGINRSFKQGDFMLIRDHISSFVPSPLRGENIDALGTRFPDMSAVYDKDARRQIMKIAAEENISLHEGVYVQTQGPNYETPSEIKMFELLGADAVGMSTVCEAIAGRHAEMRIIGMSCISNMAAGIAKTPLTHEEVKETANRSKVMFEKLLDIAITESVKKQ